jgi:hypothetical protein
MDAIVLQSRHRIFLCDIFNCDLNEKGCLFSSMDRAVSYRMLLFNVQRAIVEQGYQYQRISGGLTDTEWQ